MNRNSIDYNDLMTTKDYDNLMNVAFINAYTLGKDNKRLLLYNIDVKDERHLAFIHIVSLVKDIFGIEVFVSKGVNLFDYWRISRKCKTKKWLKRIKVDPQTSYTLLDVEDFISHIENANDRPGAFAEIYKEYFKESDR